MKYSIARLPLKGLHGQQKHVRCRMVGFSGAFRPVKTASADALSIGDASRKPISAWGQACSAAPRRAASGEAANMKFRFGGSTAESRWRRRKFTAGGVAVDAHPVRWNRPGNRVALAGKRLSGALAGTGTMNSRCPLTAGRRGRVAACGRYDMLLASCSAGEMMILKAIRSCLSACGLISGAARPGRRQKVRPGQQYGRAIRPPENQSVCAGLPAARRGYAVVSMASGIVPVIRPGGLASGLRPSSG